MEKKTEKKTIIKKKVNKKPIKSHKDKSKSTIETEKELKASQNMLQMVINSVPQHIFWKDTNSVFVGCNKNFADTVGISSPKDIVGKTDFDLVDKDKAKHFIDIDKKVIKENKALYGMEELLKKANGEEIWLNVNKVPLCDENGCVIGILGTFEDITTKISLTHKLEKNAQKYKSLIDKTNTAYIILDDKLCIIEANKIYVDLMGLESEQDIMGKNPRTWIVNNDIPLFDNAFSNLLNGIPINDLEFTFINNKEMSIVVTLSANLIENGGKKIFCLLRNISQKKVTEKIKYIEQQKKKDRLRQNLVEMRGRLRNIRVG